MAVARFFGRLHLKPWQRTLYIVVGGQVAVLMGFGIANPFLPFFIQDLGMTNFHDLALWTGIISSVAPLAQATAAPFWGMLADRYGRKPMLVRSLLGGGIMFVLIALFVQTVPQLAIGRVIQMALAGSQTAATILVASTVPRDQVGFGLGLVQTAGFLGQSLGPLLGGVIGAAFGYRAAFMCAGLLVIVMGILVTMLVQEKFVPPPRVSKEERKTNKASGSALALMVATPLLLSMVTLQLFNSFSNSVTQPMIPLVVQSLMPDNLDAAARATGMVVGGTAIANAVAAVTLGRLGDKLGRRRVIIACVSMAALMHFPQMFVKSPTQLLILRFMGGLAAGGLLPTGNAVIAEIVPSERKGSVFGMSASLNAFGRALGPMLGSVVVTSWSINSIFPVTGTLLALVAIMVVFTTRSMGKARSEAPVVATEE